MPNVSALASMTTSSSNYGSKFTIHILLDWSIKGNSVVYHLTVVDRRDSRLLVGQGVVVVLVSLVHGRRLSDSAGAAIYPVCKSHQRCFIWRERHNGLIFQVCTGVAKSGPQVPNLLFQHLFQRFSLALPAKFSRPGAPLFWRSL